MNVPSFIDQAKLRLPVNYVFVPTKEAGMILRAMGNRTGDDLLGLIFPTTDGNDDWFVAVQYEKSGYIKDDDAKDWNADELLSNIRAGTEEANKERRARGIPEMDVTGWIERPRYDATTHQLKWSIASKDKDAPAGAPQGINYNTYTLGREGFITTKLVTDLKSVEAQKPLAAKLLAGLTFNDGKRYADFNSNTDKVAEYGLAALVGGIAAKKLGLLALAAAFFAKFAKVIGLGALVLAGGLFKWRKGKKAARVAVAAPVPPGPDTPPESKQG